MAHFHIPNSSVKRPLWSSYIEEDTLFFLKGDSGEQRISIHKGKSVDVEQS